MRVLYIDQTGQLGGGEIALLPWLCYGSQTKEIVLFEDGPFRPLLEACGVRVDVLEMQELKQVKRESSAGSLLKKLPALLALRSKIRERSAAFDVLYANSQKAFLLACLSKRPRQKVVWHLRDILTAQHFSGTLRRLAVFMGNHFASIVIVNSAATGDAFIRAGGQADKVRVVHDGVSAKPFDAVERGTIRKLRDELGAGAHPLIGVFGRLSPWKGQHIFLEAMSEMPDARGVIVGDCLFGEDEYADTLRVRAGKQDLNGRIHFLGFRQDIPALMCAMDLVVHTSVSAEPFGLVIVEGMLAKRPVIATRAGGAMEIIEEGESGLLVSPGSATELRDCCRLLLNDSEMARKMALAGRERAENNFSTNSLCVRLSDLLDSLA